MNKRFTVHTVSGVLKVCITRGEKRKLYTVRPVDAQRINHLVVKNTATPVIFDDLTVGFMVHLRGSK